MSSSKAAPKKKATTRRKATATASPGKGAASFPAPKASPNKKADAKPVEKYSPGTVADNLKAGSVGAVIVDDDTGESHEPQGNN